MLPGGALSEKGCILSDSVCLKPTKSSLNWSYVLCHCPLRHPPLPYGRRWNFPLKCSVAPRGWGSLGGVGGLCSPRASWNLFEDKRTRGSVCMPVATPAWLDLSDLRLHRGSELFTLKPKGRLQTDPFPFLSIGSCAF